MDVFNLLFLPWFLSVPPHNLFWVMSSLRGKWIMCKWNGVCVEPWPDRCCSLSSFNQIALFFSLFVLFQPPQMLWKPLVLTRCNKSALSCDLWPAGPLRCVQNCRLIAKRVLTDDCNASVAIGRRSVMHLVALTAADCWSVNAATGF